MLVLTVGGLVTVVGGALTSTALFGRTPSPEMLAVAAGSAAALAGIDVVYVRRGRIAPTYLADAVVQIGLIGGLAAGLRRQSSG